MIYHWGWISIHIIWGVNTQPILKVEFKRVAQNDVKCLHLKLLFLVWLTRLYISQGMNMFYFEFRFLWVFMRTNQRSPVQFDEYTKLNVHNTFKAGVILIREVCIWLKSVLTAHMFFPKPVMVVNIDGPLAMSKKSLSPGINQYLKCADGATGNSAVKSTIVKGTETRGSIRHIYWSTHDGKTMSNP